MPQRGRGGRRGGNESGGGSPPPPPSGTGSLCSPRRQWPDTCGAAELPECKWVKTWRKPLVPTSALRSRRVRWDNSGLRTFLRGRLRRSVQWPPQCASAPNALPFPQSRIGFPSLLPYAHLGHPPAPRAMGWPGVGAHLGQLHLGLKAGGKERGRAARPLGSRAGRAGRAGGAPSVSAVPVGRALRCAPTGATFKVNHPRPAPCPSPASRHLSQWRGAGGGRGSGGREPPRVIIPALGVAPAPLRWSP